jgi:hypothetical protein
VARFDGSGGRCTSRRVGGLADPGDTCMVRVDHTGILIGGGGAFALSEDDRLWEKDLGTWIFCVDGA